MGDDIKGFCAALAGEEGAKSDDLIKDSPTYADLYQEPVNQAISEAMKTAGK